MPFLRNAWYVIAWSDELGTDLFHRRVLGEDILLVRDPSGVAYALRNRCLHRFAPLHRGRLIDGLVQCAYHGLRFALNGRCVHNPQGDGRLTPGMVIRPYPLIEKQGLLWIWLGDPARAQAEGIPDFIGLDPTQFAINKGYLHTPANYELMTDNIMDLGHIEFLHGGLLGSEAVSRAEAQVRVQDGVVFSNRLVRNETLPATLDALFETGGQPVDRWLDVRWHAPANMHLTVGVTAAGATERVGREAPGVHLMTPETETTTHYFWSNARNFRRDDEALHRALDEGLRYAFEHQDKPMIEAVGHSMDGEDFWDLRPTILACDAGAVRARLILRKLIRDEQTMGREVASPAEAPRMLGPEGGERTEI